MKKRNLLFAILLIVAFAVFALGSGEESPKPAGTLASTEAPTEAATPEFGIGESAQLKNVIATMVSVTESTGSSYNKPAEGNVFVLCELEIENNSDRELNISSMMSFEAYCDDYSCSFSFSALMEKGNKNQLDGTIAPGKKFNGVVGYEVPSDWKELELHFTPDVFFGNSIIFTATNN